MKRLLLLLFLVGKSALAQTFQMIDRVDGWLIERKRDSKQNMFAVLLSLVVDPGSPHGFASISMTPL